MRATLAAQEALPRREPDAPYVLRASLIDLAAVAEAIAAELPDAAADALTAAAFSAPSLARDPVAERERGRPSLETVTGLGFDAENVKRFGSAWRGTRGGARSVSFSRASWPSFGRP
jgi:hypothetical protein